MCEGERERGGGSGGGANIGYMYFTQMNAKSSLKSQNVFLACSVPVSVSRLLKQGDPIHVLDLSSIGFSTSQYNSYLHQDVIFFSI